jgi:tRNA(Ile)-lysidine synthase
MEILDEIRGDIGAFVRRHTLFTKADRLLVAVSGGPDSLCLLDVLRRMGYEILAAHLDHQLRPESGAEAGRVAQICRRLEVPVILAARDASTLAEGGRSLEEAARLVRYRFLAQVARDEGIRIIVTGHTADDQAETVLMHFLRGAGPAGLRGMKPATRLGEWVGVAMGDGLTLARPLLPITRQSTRAYCSQIGLDPIQDASNLDPAFTRNRLRLELLPELRTFNPQIDSNLVRIADIMSAVEALVERLVDARWPEVVAGRSEGGVHIKAGPFGKLEVALQRALLRRCLKRTNPDMRDVSYELLEGGRRFILRGGAGERHTLRAGLELLAIPGGVVLRREDQPLAWPGFPQLTASGPIPLSVPGHVALGRGWRLTSRREMLGTAGWAHLISSLGRRSVALDGGSARGDMYLRAPLPGDRFRPFGMRGSVKVAKFLMDHKIPRGARGRWPLLLCGDNILWVVGLRMAEAGRLDKASQSAVVLELLAPEGGE